MARVGMRRETKSVLERRAPLTPEDVRELVQANEVEIVVQPSVTRIYADDEYLSAGARISESLNDCGLILGIKEIGTEYLLPDKTYLFFSHVIKGQPKNMPMLADILTKRITLLDYEKVTNEQGVRLIGFSLQAGQAGMINGLWSLGQRYKALGIETPFLELKQALHYPGGLAEAKLAIETVGERIRTHGLPAAVSPLVVGITGGPGRVSRGAQSVLDALHPELISPVALLDPAVRTGLRDDRVYQVVYDMPDFLRRRDDKSYDFTDYVQHPDQYVAYLDEALPYLSLLVNGVYWEEKFPRLVTLQHLRKLYQDRRQPKLVVIADVSCDINGSIESTKVGTMPDNPVYVYNPATDEMTWGFEGDGVLKMTVEILPAEIPLNASQHFGMMLKPCLAALAGADYSVPFERLDLPPEFKRAVIAHQGMLTPAYAYIQQHLDKLSA